MKKLILLLVLLLIPAVGAFSQIVIDESMLKGSSFSIDLKVLDSLSRKPVGFASVYIKYAKDTVITNFTLSDAEGKAELVKVPRGTYQLTIEMMGYFPYHKEVYVRDNRNLGNILLREDRRQLAAATISAAGNAIEIRQDTVVYNASAFKTLDDAVLRDLLKKMPGMEVSENGVKVNGQEVNKITVNGKTFFLGNNAAALNNLPAKVVDKVKVMDKESETAEFSGIKDARKEKVMDVQLKDEYKEGWFGNAKLAGGTPVKSKNVNEFQGVKEALFSANSMLSHYDEKDQVTFVAGGYNAIAPGSAQVVIISHDGRVSGGGDGIPTSAQAGVNLSSDRIKGMTSLASVSYNGRGLDNHRRSDRSSFLPAGETLGSGSEGWSHSFGNTLNANMEIRNKDRSKFSFVFSPRLSLSGNRASDVSSSSTTEKSAVINSSDARTSSISKNLSLDAELNLGVKNLGKKRRSLSLDSEYMLGRSSGSSEEYSDTRYFVAGGADELRDLHYLDNGGSYSIREVLTYVEPVADNYAVQLTLDGQYGERLSNRLAFNSDNTTNDYYSANSNNYSTSGLARLLFQYSKGRRSIQAGADVQTEQNAVDSRSLGIDTVTGRDIWYTNWAPFFRYNDNIGKTNLSLRYSGSTGRPGQEMLSPTLDISDPMQISAGNIYLKPTFSNALNLSINGSAGDHNYSIFGGFTIKTRGTVAASWFDLNGIRYSVPVTASRPSSTITFSGSMGGPIVKDRSLRYSLYTSLSRNDVVNYQAAGTLQSIDTKNFDYGSFMSSFWGDASGSRFYSGQSGFRESRTINTNYYILASLTYSLERFSNDLTATVNNSTSRYTLNPSANQSTWENRVSWESTYTTRKEWVFASTLAYNFFSGYSGDYDEPFCSWDFNIRKNIKSMTVGLYLQDILNTARNHNRKVGEDYILDSYHSVMGRVIMLSVSFNFGKMNPARGSAANTAALMMNL